MRGASKKIDQVNTISLTSCKRVNERIANIDDYKPRGDVVVARLGGLIREAYR